MLEIIKYLNDKKIMSIFNDENIVKYRTKKEIKKLIKLYQENRSETVYKLITNINLLCNRNNEEQINLIIKVVSTINSIKNYVKNKIQNCEEFVDSFTSIYKFNIYIKDKKYTEYMDQRINELIEIVSNNNVLTKRTFEEQSMLIERYEQVDDIEVNSDNILKVKDFTYDIVLNENILNNFDIKDQIEFIDRYSKSSYSIIVNKILEILDNKILFEKRNLSEINSMLYLLGKKDDKNIYRLLMNKNILQNRTWYDQAQMIVEYDCVKEKNCFDLLIDKDILENRTCEEQIQLIELYVKYMRNDLYELIINANLLKNRNQEEQKELINMYMLTDLQEIMYYFLIDKDNNEKLSFQEELNAIRNYFKELKEDNKILKELEHEAVNIKTK